MRTWSDSPFSRIVDLADVQDRGEVIAEYNGESRIIYEIEGHPGWLAKLYIHSISAERARELEDLIALPARMNDSDRELIDSSVAWPVAQIVDGDSTVGVIIAKASDEFFASIKTVPGRVKRMRLEFDHLAMQEEEYSRRGLDSPSPRERLKIVRQIVAVGDLLERYGIVFGDWSYSNEFWAEKSHQVFVIDVDPCGFTNRPWVESNRLGDPLVPRGNCITTYTDRYKLAVLTVRGLTGERSNEAAAVGRLPQEVRNSALQQVLTRILTAPTLQERPEVGSLLRAIDDTWRELDAVEVADELGYDNYPAAEDARINGYMTDDFGSIWYESQDAPEHDRSMESGAAERPTYQLRQNPGRQANTRRQPSVQARTPAYRGAVTLIVILAMILLICLFIWGPL
jgi:hypothetical protein